MKLLIVGAGMIVKDFLTMAADVENLELAAIVGIEKEKAVMEDLAAQYGIGEVYTDYTLALEKSQADTAYIGLPNALHYRFSKKALESGKHVICEKPFVLKLQELKDLEKIANENNLILVEAITNQHLGNFQYIKENMDQLGDIKVITSNYSQYSSRYDAFKKGEILPAFNPKMGGGALMDINIYNIHLVVGLLGMPTQISYSANIENGIDTSGILQLNYDNTKAICIGAKDCGPVGETKIQGTKGTITVKGSANKLSILQLQAGGQVTDINQNLHGHRMYEEFMHFVRMIDQLDFAAAQEQMEHSKVVMEVVEQALESVGIHLG